jgi:hypothetical protein
MTDKKSFKRIIFESSDDEDVPQTDNCEKKLRRKRRRSQNTKNIVQHDSNQTFGNKSDPIAEKSYSPDESSGDFKLNDSGLMNLENNQW